MINYNNKTTNTIQDNNILPLTNEFDNILIFQDEYHKMNILSNKIEELFLFSKSYIKTNNINELENIFQVIFNYNYEKEIERGNIEYKRTLVSYDENNKTNKLISQIYWRIYEGLVSINKEYCYYIIGIEDSGLPSFLTKKEIFNSLCFISKTLLNTDLNYSYLIVKNTLLNYDYIIVKFYMEDCNLIDFF